MRQRYAWLQATNDTGFIENLAGGGGGFIPGRAMHRFSDSVREVPRYHIFYNGLQLDMRRLKLFIFSRQKWLLEMLQF